MQYITGTYYQYTGWSGGSPQFIPQCMLATISSRGDFQDASYLSNNQWNQNSECYALALVPVVNNVIAVGQIYDGWKTSALLVYTNPNLSLISVKIWSYYGDVSTYWNAGAIVQIAYDVTVAEGDGSIYVTGTVYGGFARSSTQTDCYVLRLDSSMNMIYSKSFGYPTVVTQMVCNSIQVTRNSDFIYVGGTINKSLFFAKMDQQAGNIQAISLNPNAVGETLSLRRILLEKNNAFITSGANIGNDNNYLYFCGFSTGNNGDMLYGRLTSGNVNNGGSIAFDIVLEYGSPDTENVGKGDCALTEDNNYLIGLFTTNHQVKRTVSAIQTSTFFVNGVNSQQTPYFASEAACSLTCTYNNNYRSMLSAADQSTIRTECEDAVQSAIETYTNQYDSYVYSWRTCNSYTYDMSTATCDINYLSFNPWCSSFPNYNSWYYQDAWNFDNTCCNPTCQLWEQCNNECSSFLGNMNAQKPWYNSYTTAGCPDYEMRQNVWDRIFTTPYSAVPSRGKGYSSTYPAGSYRQYMFCNQYASGTTCPFGISQDQVNWIYDQDCYSDITNVPVIQYSNWFIFRVPTAQMTTALMNGLPQMAVNFGDSNGDVIAHAVALDQYGNIYIHGISDSPAFAGSRSTSPYIYSWLHAKTHWDMTYEIQYNYQLSTAGTVTYSEPQSLHNPTFMGKRFKQPKKFTNNDNPTNPAQTGTAYQFTKLYYQVSSPPASLLSTTTVYTLFVAYQMSVPTLSMGPGTGRYWNHNYVTNFKTLINTYIWGYSFARMNYLSDINIFKPQTLSASNYVQSLEVESVCIFGNSAFGGPNDADRELYLWKNFDTDSNLPVGLSIQDNTQANLFYMYISGSLNAASEGIYYNAIRVSQSSLYIDTAIQFRCFYNNYGFFWNDKNFPQLKRFETSQRFKIIVDDQSIAIPYVALTIAQQKPVTRQLTSINNILTTYFQSCNLLYASRTMQQAPSSYQLPYWLYFHELNGTFTMYPPDTSNVVSISVNCCNTITQCTTSTFLIQPIDTYPVSLIQALDTQYIIQYDPDPLSNVGQSFEWAMTKYLIYDPDASSNPADAAYHHSSQTVNLAFTGYGIGVNSYSIGTSSYHQVQQIGLVYGQAFSLNIGLNILKYTFTDGDSNTPLQTGYIDVLVNSMPYATVTGKAAGLSSIDPCANSPLTFFDTYFPFLVQENQAQSLFSASTQSWFASSQQITYNLNRSDGTQIPQWMYYDQITGVISGTPLPIQSEMISLAFTVNDPNQGSSILYKTLLVNCAPVVVNLYQVLSLALNRQMLFNLSSMIVDPDGDILAFSIPSNIILTLNQYGLYFMTSLNAIVGSPSMTGVIGLIQIQATDVNGAYSIAYLTININNYMPLR